LGRETSEASDEVRVVKGKTGYAFHNVLLVPRNCLSRPKRRSYRCSVALHK